MLKISEEDYRSLEMKIQAEVKKIFTQFLKDLERKNTEPDETLTAYEPQNSDHLSEPDPVKSVPARTEWKRHTSKKSKEINRLLQGTTHSGPKSSTKILEDDMNKIFRKKYRKGTG